MSISTVVLSSARQFLMTALPSSTICFNSFGSATSLNFLHFASLHLFFRGFLEKIVLNVRESELRHYSNYF